VLFNNYCVRSWILALERTFDCSDPDYRIKQDIWDRFFSYYTLIAKRGFLINYPNYWFKLQGIIPPRQIIAWIKLIKIIGDDVFNKIPLALNYHLEDKKIFFLNEFDKKFKNITNLTITFTCGYFWKFAIESKRRNIMKEFVKAKIEDDCKVNIFTQDKTLKKEINLVMDKGRKPKVKRRLFRMDIHSTIIEPGGKDDKDNTLLFIELPHTERTTHRLEAYVTIGELKDFGCTVKQITKLLHFLKRQRYSYFFTKSIPSKLDLAFKWGAL